MVPATASAVLKFKAFGLAPGTAVEASFHLTAADGTGLSTGYAVTGTEVEGDGTVLFAPRLHSLTKGKAGQLHCWVRPAGSPQSAAPLSGTFGPAEVTVAVP